MTPKSTPQPSSQESFRTYLQEELLRRCRKNAGYSLRSFAKALAVNPASLSRMLRGERLISAEMQERLGQRLGLGPQELSRFAPPSVSGTAMELEQGSGRFNELSLDAFAVISDWYHYAILELMHVRGFEPVPQWVAKTLGITVSEVRVAIERLQRVKLLEVTATGQWRALTEANTNVSADIRASAHRKLQRQVLELALRALDEVPIEHRDQSSMTMAIDTALLAEAADRITHFRRELCAFLESGKKRDAVYQLSVSLFPLTQPQNRPPKPQE